MLVVDWKFKGLYVSIQGGLGGGGFGVGKWDRWVALGGEVYVWRQEFDFSFQRLQGGGGSGGC